MFAPPPGQRARQATGNSAACGSSSREGLDYYSPPRRNAMLQEQIPDLAKYVEPDRVRREVYTDPDILELEMQRTQERVWIYGGHEPQTPKAGDYSPVQPAPQPMLMV